MSVDFVRHVLDTIPNIVAVKSEQGFPLVAGVCEMYHHFRDEVVISCPIEADALPLMGVMDMQFSGTSNTEWMSGWYPETFELARTGRWPEAMERFWAVQPARQANAAATGTYITGTSVLNRTMWKYQDWLAGYNGGPLRAPAMRVPDRLMRQSARRPAGCRAARDGRSRQRVPRRAKPRVSGAGQPFATIPSIISSWRPTMPGGISTMCTAGMPISVR